jgi:hypothetical protein
MRIVGMENKKPYTAQQLKISGFDPPFIDIKTLSKSDLLKKYLTGFCGATYQGVASHHYTMFIGPNASRSWFGLMKN